LCKADGRIVQEVYSLFQTEVNAKEYFKQHVFEATPYGIRMTTDRHCRADEAHRDQGLASFAELGVPLCWSIEVNGEEHQLREAVQECVANFYLKQKELAFTALALGLYLPPDREWTNRFQEHTTFDDVVAELCGRRLEDCCCAGTHLVYSTTILLRVDEQMPIISPHVRTQLRQYLRRLVDCAISTQQPEGYWMVTWYASTPEDTPEGKWTPPDTAETRLLATSHVAEWMLHLSEELRPPDDVLRRAGEWMLRELLRGSGQRTADLCPRSHAVGVLQCISRIASE
jgi:hypothetical protein